MLVLVVALLACAALAYVVVPLGQRRGRREETPSMEGELDARKLSALTAIVDLEADRSVGKLSQEDFEILRAQYEAEALRALVELDDLRSRADEPRDPSLEDEIAEMRARLACSRCGGLLSTEGVCPQCQTAT
ncbi:MAG: hypothetical protein M3271_08290 [Actinomycetota bacterium]|nr:hypothetical protein [Actinomycetota bacterium]